MNGSEAAILKRILGAQPNSERVAHHESMLYALSGPSLAGPHPQANLEFEHHPANESMSQQSDGVTRRLRDGNRSTLRGSG